MTKLFNSYFPKSSLCNWTYLCNQNSDHSLTVWTDTQSILTVGVTIPDRKDM